MSMRLASSAQLADADVTLPPPSAAATADECRRLPAAAIHPATPYSINRDLAPSCMRAALSRTLKHARRVGASERSESWSDMTSCNA